MAKGDLESARLRQWFLANSGVLEHDVDIVYDAANGVHLRARTDIETARSAPLLACPFSLSISHLNAVPPAERPLKVDGVPFEQSLASSLRLRCPAHVVANFILAEQKVRKESSRWAEYVTMLPREEEMSTPLFWGEGDLRWLKGTNLAADRDKRCEKWKGEWRGAQEQLKGCWDGGGDVLPGDITWELYLWAATIFSSRSFTSNAVFPSVEDSFAILFPVADIPNHSNDSKAHWWFDDGKLVIATGATKAGQQIYNNYGPKGNEELLMGYGFCIPNNPHDTVGIQLSKPPDPVIARLKELYPDRFDGDWSPEQANFRLGGLQASGEDAMLGIKCIPPVMLKVFVEYARLRRPALFTRGSDPPTHAGRLLLAAIAVLIVHLHAKLASLNSDDPSSRNGDGMSTNKRNAMIYREGQMRVLTDAENALRAVLRRVPRNPDDASGPLLLDLEAAVHLLGHRHAFSRRFKHAFLEPAYGTSDVAAIREQDCEDEAWILWLYWAYCTTLPESSEAGQIKEYMADLLDVWPVPTQVLAGDESVMYFVDKLRVMGVKYEELCKDTEKVVAWAVRVVQGELMRMEWTEGGGEVLVLYVRGAGAEEVWFKDVS